MRCALHGARRTSASQMGRNDNCEKLKDDSSHNADRLTGRVEVLREAKRQIHLMPRMTCASGPALALQRDKSAPSFLVLCMVGMSRLCTKALQYQHTTIYAHPFGTFGGSVLFRRDI